ncbi:unnamed protein product [Cyprideis torosa]|uniref:Uncharacterized protein n=1 Tax=Cyprideis torosa TaxID=163714 RepID=A0A7R8WGI9_9CRUS|nr:unnamed protein product [Cyprideis torosa]CAG0896689.1 unnamed protein product [Cyprideis torosa]
MEGKTMPVGFVVKSSSIRASYGDTSELTLGKNLSAVPPVPRRFRSMHTCEDMNYFIRERNRFVVLFVMKHSRSPVISADMKGRIRERNRFVALFVLKHFRVPLLSAVMKGRMREINPSSAVFAQWVSLVPVTSSGTERYILLRASRDLPSEGKYEPHFHRKQDTPVISALMKGRMREINPSSAVFAQRASLVPVTSSGTERYILLDLPSHPITSSGIEGYILLRASRDFIFIENRKHQLLLSAFFGSAAFIKSERDAYSQAK